MTPKEYQVSLLDAMESWRDQSLPPDSPDQPSQYLQYRQDYMTVNQQNAVKQQTPTEAPQVMRDDMVGVPGFQFSPGAFGEAYKSFDFGRGIDDVIGSSQGWIGRQFDIPEWAEAGAEKKRVRDLYDQSDLEWESAMPSWAGGGTVFDKTITPYMAPEEQRKIAVDWPGQIADMETGTIQGLQQSVVPMGAALATGAGAGLLGAGAGLASLIGVVGGMVPTMFGPLYEDALDKGMDHEDATWDSVARTTFEAGPELLPFLKLFGPMGKSALGYIAKVGGASAVSEAVTGWLNLGYDAYQSGEMPDTRSIIKDSLQNLQLGGLLGTSMAVPGVAAQKLMGQQSPQPEALPEVTGLPEQPISAKHALAEKEARAVAGKLPFGGMVNIIQGEVDRDGSAEYIPPVEDQTAQINIHIGNLISRSDGTRNGIRKQVIEDLHHEIGGHDFVDQQLRQNPDFVADAFKANQDLILVWQKDSAYAGDKLEGRDDILFEEWVAQFPENDTRLIKRIELAIVNYLHKIIGKDATAKLVKSWDARNITIRNMAQDYIKQVQARGAAGETQAIQNLTPEQAAELQYPVDADVILRQSKDTSVEDLAAARAERELQETILDEQLASVERDVGIPETGVTTRESKGKIQDPSRRKFLKQAGGAVAGAAVDPSILLEPATPTPPVAPPGFSGFGAGPGIAPEYEAMVKAGEMASPSGLVSDVASRAFDDFDADVALEEDRARQTELDEYEAKEAAETEAEGDAELYVKIVDEILSIYDTDAPAVEAARDGTLNNRIISYAAETPFTREELWEGVDQRIEELAEDTAEPTGRFSRERKPKSETVQRDINEEKGKANKRILAADIEDAEKEVRTKLLKRLQNVMGSPARKRGINAGDQDVFKEQAAKIEAGDIDAVETFITPFEEELTGSSETVRMADRRRALRAERIGKTDAEILKYRPKGAKHPMEGKMTYPFAMEEIDKQEKAGEITAEEAEIRRLAVNNVRRIFKGKAGPTVKRTITEAVYGIGAYEDLVPWSEVYTEEQTEEMGERAEIGQAEARRTRYDPTDLTDKERTDLLEATETAEEKSILDAAEGNPPYPDVDKFDSNQDPVFNAFQKTMLALDTRAERLAFLRAPAEFKSETEEKEMIEFRNTLKTKEPYDERKVQEKAEKEKEDLISKAMAEGRFTELPPAEITKITDYQRSVVNVEPAGWDRIRTIDEVDRETAFEIYGDAYTEQGELINDSEMELLDPNGVMPRHRESRGQRGKIAPNKWIKHREHGIGLIQDVNLDKMTVRFEDNSVKELAVNEKYELGDPNDPEMGGARVLSSQPMEDKNIIKAARGKMGLTDKRSGFDAARRKEDKDLSTDEGKAHMSAMGSIHSKINKSMNWSGRSERLSPRIEHIDNITPRVIETGEIAEQDRGKSEIDNLVSVPKYIHDIKTKFESFIQSATPYKDIEQLYDKGEIDKKLHGITKEQAREISSFRKRIKSKLNVAIEKGDYSANTFLKAYIESMGLKYAANTLRLSEKENNAVAALMRVMARQSSTESYFDKRANEITAGSKSDMAVRFSKAKKKDKGYTEHFNDGFWYTITSFLWGKPVQSIRDINKSSRFGSKQGKITAADKIADLIQRAQSSTKRAEGMKGGTDMMQDVSMRSGEFYTKLSRIFALATGRAGAINVKGNAQLIDHLMGKDVKFANKDLEKAATELKALLESVYTYGKEATSDLTEPLDLRGAADTLVPRVWNIEYIATRKGKADFLRAVNKMLHTKGDISVTPEEMYEAVINSGGFVQGDWTNVKSSATRSEKDVERDLLIGETLDGMSTPEMMEAGLVIDDVQALIPRFIQKAIERTEYSRRFGKNDELLRDMIDEGIAQIRTNNAEVLKLGENPDGLMHIDEKKFTKAVWDMARILRNQYGYDMANMATRKWLQRAANTETILKLPLVTLASIPEFFTPMLKGDVRPDKWFVDFMAGTAWAGYKGMNGLSKLLFNTHLPAMRKASKDIGGMGIISDMQLLRELGVADIQAMGDLVSTRYANPNFARGGLRAGAKGTIAGKVPKNIRAVFNMQTFMQGTMLTTMTEMQQLMALRNFQRHMGRRVQFVNKNKGKDLKGRKARLMKQFTQDLADYGITGEIDLDTTAGQAAFNSGALRFVDQVITRPNDATTAKAFKNPLTAPLVLFKRFITTYGNTLMTSIGNDFATKTSNVERAKQVAQVASVAMIMYGSVMFAEIIRGVLKGDLDEEDFKLMPKDFAQFMRRLDRTGLSSAPGAVAINLGFPYKRGWWDTTEARVMNELLGPLGGDLTSLGDSLISGKNNSWDRLLGQLMPVAKPLLRNKKKKRLKSEAGKGVNW